MSPLPANVTVLSELSADASSYRIDAAALQALDDAERRHFWFRARNEWILGGLSALGCRAPARVLDLGCGSGSVSAALDGAGYQVTGVDGHLPRVLEAAQRSPRARFFVHDLERGAGAFGRDFDAVGLFDVIEHLDEPRVALRDAVACARPGGWVVGTVPALRALWSQADVFAAHRRRFEARELRNELARVEGADVVEVRPFFRSLVPMLFAQRRVVSALRPPASAEVYVAVPPAPVNLAMRALLRLERRVAPLLDVAHVPGASLWFALRRQGEAG